VKQVTNVMVEITSALEQQSNGVNQIEISVEQMNHITQTVVSNAEESAGAGEELNRQAIQMKSMVRMFQLTNNCAFPETSLSDLADKEHRLEQSPNHAIVQQQFIGL